MTVFDFPNPTGPALARPPRLPIDATDRDRRQDITRHLVGIAHGLAGLAEEGLDTDHLLDLAELTKAIGRGGEFEALDEAADVIRRIAVKNGQPAPPYPFCHTPSECASKGYCRRDPACNE